MGGMAKGAAGALAIEVAKSCGVHSVYLSVGGNIFTIGKKEDGSSYRFGVRDPRGESSDYIGIVELTDTTMATSGDYERYFEEKEALVKEMIDNNISINIIICCLL